MNTARILIALSNDALIIKLTTILTEVGFTVIEPAKDGPDCLRKMRLLRPDIIVIEYNLPMMNGQEISKIALEDKICDVVMLVTLEQDNMLEDIRNETGFVSLVKPVSRTLLARTLEFMLKNSKKIRQLEKEIVELRSSLDTRKEVEKAKGLLMTNLGLSEHDAFKRIQKQSMDRGIAMKEIAKAIILAYDI